MTVATLQIFCGEMYVRNTGYFPGSPRVTDELPCDGTLTLTGDLVPGWNVGPEGLKIGLRYTFPQCLVER